LCDCGAHKKNKREKIKKTIFEKTIEDQLDISLETLRVDVPIHPSWGIKKNSEGKNTFWLEYKAHLAGNALPHQGSAP
jgi:transposase